MKKTLMIAVLMLMIFSVGVASAATLIAGKIYNSDFSETISDAFVSVVCNSTTSDTVSLSDGTYGIRFAEYL